MSRENVELIRQVYAWLASGQAERAFDVYRADVEWDASAAPWLLELGVDPIYRGHEGVRAAFGAWLEAWETIEYRPEELLDCGDEVLAFVRISARGRASGIEITYEHPQLWTLEDGQIVRMRVFDDRAAAMDAAGLT